MYLCTPNGKQLLPIPPILRLAGAVCHEGRNRRDAARGVGARRAAYPRHWHWHGTHRTHERFPAAEVVGIDIDADAVAQARENVAKSPFASRVMVGQADVAGYCAEPFHAIVTNPPYFVDALTCPDPQRTAARHAASLPYAVLMDAAWRLLRDDGELSIIIPFDCKSELLSEALLRGFFVSCDCAVRTTPRKQPKRFLLAFRKHPSAQVETGCFSLEEPAGVRSPWYAELTKDFYL